MRELHKIGEYCWSDADGACVRDRLLGRLLDDIVSLLVVTTNIAAPDADASDKGGTAAHDELQQQSKSTPDRNYRTSLLEIRRSKLRQFSY